ASVDSFVAFQAKVTSELEALTRQPHGASMPVIVAPLDFDAWVDAGLPVTPVARLFAPFPPHSPPTAPVSGRENEVQQKGPRRRKLPDGPVDETLLLPRSGSAYLAFSDDLSCGG